VTLPETPAQTRQQDLWRNEIKNNPAAAARDTRLLADYKAPVWINANIHGDEWEGTDAAMRLIRELATTMDPHLLDVLAHTKIVVNVTANPDGRVRVNGRTRLGSTSTATTHLVAAGERRRA